MSYCTGCGASIEPTNAFCKHCGAAIPKAAGVPPPPASGEAGPVPYGPDRSAQPRPLETSSPAFAPPTAAPPGPGAYAAPPGPAAYAAPYPGPNPVGPVPGALADWSTRAGGYLLDLALIIAGMIPFFVLGVIAPLFDVLALFAWIGILIYFALQVGQTGQSPGMRVVGIKCVHQQTRQPIGGGLGVVRLLATYLNSLILYIGWLFPLWDAQRQTIADKVMTTVVINVPRQNFSLVPPR